MTSGEGPLAVLPDLRRPETILDTGHTEEGSYLLFPGPVYPYSFRQYVHSGCASLGTFIGQSYPRPSFTSGSLSVDPRPRGSVLVPFRSGIRHLDHRRVWTTSLSRIGGVTDVEGRPTLPPTSEGTRRTGGPRLPSTTRLTSQVQEAVGVGYGPGRVGVSGVVTCTDRGSDVLSVDLVSV